MAYGQSQMTFTEKLTSGVTLDNHRVLMIRKSYLLLVLAVLGMATGGYIGVNSPLILSLFTGWIGWILAMVALNAVPMIAMKFQHDPTIGTLMLFVDGLIAGLVISPMLYFAERVSGYQLVTSAGIITLAIFAGVSVYVYISGTRWAPSRGLYMGIFFGLIGAVVLNMFLNIGFLGILIALGIGVIGVMALVSATSEVLNNPNIQSPVPAALMLFSGVFMIFQAVMHLLMAFTSRD